MVGKANISAWLALESIFNNGLNSHNVLWGSCEFKLIYQVTEVLLLILKGYECVQSLLGPYVAINKNINWRAQLFSDAALFSDDIFHFFSFMLIASKDVMSVRHCWGIWFADSVLNILLLFFLLVFFSLAEQTSLIVIFSCLRWKNVVKR